MTEMKQYVSSTISQSTQGQFLMFCTVLLLSFGPWHTFSYSPSVSLSLSSSQSDKTSITNCGWRSDVTKWEHQVHFYYLWQGSNVQLCMISCLSSNGAVNRELASSGFSNGYTKVQNEQSQVPNARKTGFCELLASFWLVILRNCNVIRLSQTVRIIVWPSLL